MKILPLPPLELLQERFYVSEDSPSGLRNKKQLGARGKKDAVTGSKNSGGYYIVKIDNVIYRVHGIVYFLATGKDPEKLEVDHKFGITNPLDLRKSTHSENGCNRVPKKGKRYKGIYKKRSKWYAEINKNTKRIRLGGFATAKEAAAAYNEKALELHGEFAWLNTL